MVELIAQTGVMNVLQALLQREHSGVSLRIDWISVSSRSFVDDGYFGNDRKIGGCSEKNKRVFL